jgi:hypothetical protein
VLVRTEGEFFCGPSRRKQSRLPSLGRSVYNQFIRYVNIVESFYGAILIEYSLEEPDELQKDPRSLAFRDFYVATSWIGVSRIAQVRSIAGASAYCEDLRTGLYVSMSPEVNPNGAAVDTQVAGVTVLTDIDLLPKGTAQLRYSYSVLSTTPDDRVGTLDPRILLKDASPFDLLGGPQAKWSCLTNADIPAAVEALADFSLESLDIVTKIIHVAKR